MLLKWKLFYGNLELVGVWPSGKATGFGPVIQRFESFHPRNSEIQYCNIVDRYENRTQIESFFIRTPKRIV
jgi:hypothetical protein